MANLTPEALAIQEQCPIDDQAQSTLNFVFYTVWTPIYFVLGTAGHVLMLLAYYEQAKLEAAYWQQIFVTLSEFVQIITTTVFIIFMKWLNDAQVKPDWYQRCYPCIWFTCHLSAPLPNMFMTSSLLLSVSMAADRLYAIARPIAYKNGNIKMRHMVSGVICLFLGITTTLFDCFQADTFPADENGFYKFQWHDRNPDWTKFAANLRSALRVGATIILILCNAGLVYCFRARSRRVEHMANNSVNDGKNKEKERLLMLIGVVQSCSMSLSMGYHSVCFGMNLVSNWFIYCGWRVMWPTVDFIVEISEVINFYLMIATSAKYRNMIKKVLPAFCRRENNNVVTVGQSTNITAQSMVETKM